MMVLSRYALVNIVMGDIADIEKKKSKGLSTLLLGAKPNQMVQVLKKAKAQRAEAKFRISGSRGHEGQGLSRGCCARAS